MWMDGRGPIACYSIQERPRERGQPLAKRTIDVLLVEDDPVAAGLFHAQLASDFSTRYDLQFAGSIAGALEKIAEASFDVVVLDLVLPDARDLEGLDRLRSEASHLPVVVTTGLDDEEVAEAALRHGAQDYLVKGEITGRLLTRSLRYAVERQRLTEALRELALIDEPTGLYNRRGFTALAEPQINVARRLQRGLALINVQPPEGAEEPSADRLRRAAEIVRDTCRGSDLLGRFDGPRFHILTVERSLEGAETAAERLRKAMRGVEEEGLIVAMEWLPPDRQVTVQDLVDCSRRPHEAVAGAPPE